MNLNAKMSRGIGGILRAASRFYGLAPAAQTFITQTLPLIRENDRIRAAREKKGEHIPPFLIASVAAQCNLRCAGCYARESGTCCDETAREELTAGEWEKVFDEAASLGISFILLAGGEPLLRRDVMAKAANYSSIIFPIFTNGTVVDPEYEALFDENRNLIPIFSLEGGAEQTDGRRGAGTHAIVEGAMDRLRAKNILFGASITVTRENIATVTDGGFLSDLREKGCGAVFWVEYVPATPGTEHLVLKDADLRLLREASRTMKRRFRDMILLCFPGDEAAMGGCLASGRGFFHINPYGGAEPCPFSANSLDNVQSTSILQVVNSPYFRSLRELSASVDLHEGGCALFARQTQVLSLMASGR